MKINNYIEIESDIYADFDKYPIEKFPELPKDVYFGKGKSIDYNLDLPLTFHVNYTHDWKPSHFPTSLKIPVISGKLLKELRRFGVSNIQSFPALLKNVNLNLEWDDFFCINIIDEVVANASFEKDGRMSVNEYNRVIIDKTKASMSGKLLFILAGKRPAEIYIADFLLNKLIEIAPSETWGITIYNTKNV